ncbi:hypothetical protein QFZ99_001431 [Paraburkholderia atlantica]
MPEKGATSNWKVSPDVTITGAISEVYAGTEFLQLPAAATAHQLGLVPAS